MSKQTVQETLVFPAGQYYIGDLCYVMSDDEWDEVCKLTIKDRKCLEGIFTMKDGRTFALFHTAWGDGVYSSNMGTSHSVDSGTIGCILKSAITVKEDPQKIRNLGAFRRFRSQFIANTVDGHSGGMFQRKKMICFGSMRIQT